MPFPPARTYSLWTVHSGSETKSEYLPPKLRVKPISGALRATLQALRSERPDCSCVAQEIVGIDTTTTTVAASPRMQSERAETEVITSGGGLAVTYALEATLLTWNCPDLLRHK